MMATDRIDELVARRSKVSDETLAEVPVDARGVLGALRDVGLDHAGANASAPAPRRRARRGVVAGIVAAALTVTTATAAGWISARTGVEADGSQDMGTGEMIRLDGSDLDAVVDRLSRGIPVPPGGGFQEWTQGQRGTDPTTMSSSGLRWTLAFVAACQWTGYWLDAFDRGDRTAMGRAQAVLDEIPAWPEFASGGITNLLRTRAEGARQGNPAMFQQDYDINCAGASPVGPGGG